MPMLTDPRLRKLWGILDPDAEGGRRGSSDAQLRKALDEASSMRPVDVPLLTRAAEACLKRMPEAFSETIKPAILSISPGTSDAVGLAWVLMENGDALGASDIISNIGDAGCRAQIAAARAVCAYHSGWPDALNLLMEAWELDPDEERLYPGLSQLDPETGWQYVRSMEALHRRDGLPEPDAPGGRYAELYDCCRMWDDGLKDDAMKAVRDSPLYRDDPFCKIVYARMCANRGLYPKAADTYRDVLNSEPGWLFAAAEEASVLRKSGDRAAAVDLCRSALERDPTNRLLLEAMIAAALEAGRKHEADVHIGKLLALRPEDARDYARCAARLSSAGFTADATSLVRRMAARCSDVGYAELQLAVRANAEKDHQVALEHANKSLKARPGDVDALCEKARALLALGRTKKAMDAVDEALAPDVSDLRPLSVRRDVLIALGESDRALDLYDRMIAERPGSADLQRGRAELLASMGMHAEALEGYRDALNAREDARLFRDIILALLKERDVDSLCRFVDDFDDIYGRLPEVWMIRGNAEYLAQRYDDAVSSYARVAALSPNDPAVWYSKGLSEMKSGSLMAAQTSFDRAIILDLENPEYWISKALVQEDMDDIRGAVKSINRVISMSPDDPEPVIIKARLLVRAGMYVEAMAFLEMALRMRPGSMEVLVMQKDVSVRMGDLDKAEEICNRILCTDHWDPGAAVDLAFIYAETGRVEDGRRLLDDLCVHVPDSCKALRGKARFMERYGSMAEAMDAYEILLTVCPDDRESAEVLAAMYRTSGEDHRADELMARFEERTVIPEVPAAPSMDEIRRALEDGDEVLAVTLLRAAVEAGSHDPEIYLALSEMMLDLGNNSEAISAAEVGRVIFPADVGILWALGRAHRVAGDTISALGVFNEAVGLGVSDADMLIEKGNTELDLGLYRPAMESYLAALRLDPDSRDAAMRLSRVYVRLGDRDRAAPLLDDAIAADPTDPEALMMRAEIHSWNRDREGLLLLYEPIRNYVDDPEDLMIYASALRSVGAVAEADSLFGDEVFTEVPEVTAEEESPVSEGDGDDAEAHPGAPEEPTAPQSEVTDDEPPAAEVADADADDSEDEDDESEDDEVSEDDGDDEVSEDEDDDGEGFEEDEGSEDDHHIEPIAPVITDIDDSEPPSQEEIEAAAARLLTAAVSTGRSVDNPALWASSGVSEGVAAYAVRYMRAPDRYPFINPGDDFFEEMEDNSFKVIVEGGINGIESSPAVPIETVSAALGSTDLSEVRRLQAYIHFALTNDDDPIAFSREVEAIAEEIKGQKVGIFTVMDHYGVGVHTARTAIRLNQ